MRRNGHKDSQAFQREFQEPPELPPPLEEAPREEDVAWGITEEELNDLLAKNPNLLDDLFPPDEEEDDLPSPLSGE